MKAITDEEIKALEALEALEALADLQDVLRMTHTLIESFGLCMYCKQHGFDIRKFRHTVDCVIPQVEAKLRSVGLDPFEER